MQIQFNTRQHLTGVSRIGLPWCILVVYLCTLSAQDIAPAPSIQLEYSRIIASAGTISVMRVPILSNDGTRIFKDFTVRFELDTDGNLVVSNGYPTVVSSPELVPLTFQAGKYLGPQNVANGKAIVMVGGPGVTGNGGTTWSLLSADDSDKCVYPGSATWYVGPIENDPQAARLKRAGSEVRGSDQAIGITSTAWSYGVSGAGPSFSCSVSSNSPDPTGTYYAWQSGSLIGVSQSGNTLTIASFTKSGVDYSVPVDQITYILRPSAETVTKP